jgi:hypothetical protein
MSARSPRFWWLPPFLVGTSAAIAAEVAIGLLLYGGPGFIRSLTTILAVEGVALAGGLWRVPLVGPDLVDRLRRRWLFCLVAFLAATVFGTAWGFIEGIGEGRLGQGFGLAILAGVPLYAAGTVLGGMSVVLRNGPAGRPRSAGAPAVAGAALGFVVTGLLLPRVPTPASLLVACLVLLSLGGMIFGSVLESRLEIEVKARRASRGGDVRVEDRRLPISNVAVRQLFEGQYLRREVSLGENGVAPWDVALIRALMPGAETAWRVLLVGGGASTAPRTLLREHPGGAVDVIERTGAVVALGREHFDTDLAIARGERLRVEVDNLEDLVGRLTSRYDLVVVDTAALAAVGGVSGLSQVSRRRLLDVVEPGGLMAWGPLATESGMPEVPDGWAHTVFRRSVTGSLDEHVVVTGAMGAATWPTPFDGFESLDGAGPDVVDGSVPEP